MRHDLLEALRVACAARGTRELTVVSEWLGYLPFGVYIWVEIAGASVPDAELPTPWDSKDIQQLLDAGALELVERQVLDKDGFDTRTRCRLPAP